MMYTRRSWVSGSMMLIMLTIVSLTENVTAQERFFTSPNRGGADGARQTTQLQQETNRGIAHQISITALEADLSAVSATAANGLSDLTAAVAVSLTSAGDVSCGNQGMLMGPSHTIAVGKCVPALTIAPTGRVVLTGGLKLGSEGNCDGASAGTMRYEAAQKVVQFCDGTSWQEVGASPAISGPFTAVTGANLSTVVTSNAITVSGFAGTRTATATGGAILLVNGAPQGATANVSAGNTVALQVTSSSSYDTAVNVGFSVTSIVTNWSVTTRSQDTSPNAFSFADLTNQSVDTVVISNAVTVSGFDNPVTASVSGLGTPEIQIAGGAWMTSGAIGTGQTLRVRIRTSANYGSAHAASIAVGSYSTNWTVTTNSGSCVLPWGGSINHGQSVTAYQSQQVCGQTCSSQSRVCSAGTLSGTYTNQSCSASVGPCWVVENVSAAVGDNGCAFSVIGQAGGNCSEALASAKCQIYGVYCLVDGSGNIIQACGGGGFGPGNYNRRARCTTP